MKKITILLFLFIFALGYSQVPTSAAPIPPARAAGDVISIYGSAYTNITGINTNPSWGQNTVVTEVALAGDNALQYSNFNYQGTDFANNAQNISAMQFLHVDVWTNAQSPNIYAISSGPEESKAISSIAGSWQSLNIPVAGLTGNLNSVIQFKFDFLIFKPIYSIENLMICLVSNAAPAFRSVQILRLISMLYIKLLHLK